MTNMYDTAKDEMTKDNNHQERAFSIDKVRDILETKIIEIFQDQNGDAWVYYDDGNKKYCVEVEGVTFEDFVRVEINRITGRPTEAYVAPIVKLFASRARQEEQRTLHLRRANINGAWIIQTGKNTAIKIAGGEITTIEPGTLFRNFRHQRTIEIDLNATIEDLNLLPKYINFRDKQERELFITILPAYAIPHIQKPIQLSRGPAGSAKSTLGRVTKIILDPSTARDGISYPKDDRDWEVNCREHDIVILDNLSHLTKDQQDECCKIVTGKASNRRKLYTDTESYNTNLKATLLINAIDLSDLHSDFLDRSFIFDLARVEEEDRIPEEDFYKNFERDLPRIRGAIIKTLAKAQITTIDVKDIPPLRLRDFARYSVACAIARGIASETFREWMVQKIELQKDESIAQSPVIEPLTKFMEHHNGNEWIGTPTELLRILTEQEYGTVEGDPLHERTVIRNVPPNWYKTPTKLTEALNRIGFLLPRLGIQYEKKRTKSVRKIILKKIGETCVTCVTQEDLSSIKEGGEYSQFGRHLSSPASPKNDNKVTGDGWVTIEKNQPSPGFLDDEELRVTQETIVSDNFSKTRDTDE